MSNAKTGRVGRLEEDLRRREGAAFLLFGFAYGAATGVLIGRALETKERAEQQRRSLELTERRRLVERTEFLAERSGIARGELDAEIQRAREAEWRELVERSKGGTDGKTS